MKKKYSIDTEYRTDRVKKKEKARIIKLRAEGNTIEEIAAILERNKRTISKYLEEAKQMPDRISDQLVDKEKLDNHNKQLVKVAEMLCEYVGIQMINTEEVISGQLRFGVVNVECDPDFGEEYFEFFLSHIKSEDPDIDTKDKYLAMAENDPKRIRKILKRVIARGTLKGRCDACP